MPCKSMGWYMIGTSVMKKLKYDFLFIVHNIYCNIPLVRSFVTIPNLLNSFKYSKSSISS